MILSSGWEVAATSSLLPRLRSCALANTPRHPAAAAPAQGLTPAELEVQSRELLGSVRLLGAAAQQTGTYSGGMRRRLSVAIALLGDPLVSELLGSLALCALGVGRALDSTGKEGQTEKRAWGGRAWAKRRGEPGHE